MNFAASQSAGNRALLWTGGAILVAATLLAYIPAFFAGFVFDDTMHILLSPTMTYSWDSLAAIWFKPAWTPQYYPVTHTVWWLEYQLWGFTPLGYHLVNLVLHLGVVFLLWRLLHRLGLDWRVAWLAAALFALHPVHVESAAYVSELKNVLSAVFYLVAALCYWRFHAGTGTSASARTAGDIRTSWRWYGCALVLFLAALLSKTVTASLPAAMLLIIWWKDDRIRWHDVRRLVPFFILGIGLGLTTAWLERHQVGTAAFEHDFGFSPADRILIAGRAVWFYFTKLLWPTNLTMNYVRWTIEPSAWRQWLFPIAAVVAIGALWLGRRVLGRGPLVAILFFCGTLFPALGFVDVYPFRYSFVSDHYQYLATIGVLVLMALVWVRLWRWWRSAPAITPLLAAAPLLVLLGILTWQHTWTFKDDRTLWEDAVAKNPQSWLGHFNLSSLWLAEGDLDQAMQHMQQAMELRPNAIECRNRYATILSMQGRRDDAIAYLRSLIRDDLADDSTYLTLVGLLVQEHAFEEALQHAQHVVAIARDVKRVLWAPGAVLLAAGRAEEARKVLETAVQVGPLRMENHQYLAQALLALDRVAEATASFQMAARILPHSPDLQSQVSELLWRQGRRQEALRHLAYAVEAAPEAPMLRVTFAERLMTAGAERKGLRQLRKAAELAPQDPELWYRLAAAQARLNLSDDAQHTGRRAMELARETDNGSLVRSIEKLLAEIGMDRGRRPLPAQTP